MKRKKSHIIEWIPIHFVFLWVRDLTSNFQMEYLYYIIISLFDDDNKSYRLLFPKASKVLANIYKKYKFDHRSCCYFSLDII